MKKILKFSSMLLIIILIVTGCSSVINNSEILAKDNQLNKSTSQIEKEMLNTQKDDSLNLEVHFINVGQGDSIFIKQAEQTMLIDAGDNEYGSVVVDYLKNQNVEKLDYIIGTHPHADHIGGLDDVINAFTVKTIIMPNKLHNTKTFEDVLKAIKKQNLKITTPIVGDVYSVGLANFTILSPNKKEYNNLNNYSVSIRLQYENQSFFFSGDNEAVAEKEIVNNGQLLKSTIMKAGHHGSTTSNSKILLDKVNPEYVIIQVGQKNKYGHPNDDILKRLEDKNITVYRTDLHGNIIITTDGKDLEITTENKVNLQNDVKINKNNLKEDLSKTPSNKTPSNKTKNNKTSNIIPSNNDNKENLVFIGTKSTKKFHKSDCRYVPKKENQVNFSNFEEAIDAGYEACKVCKPGK